MTDKDLALQQNTPLPSAFNTDTSHLILVPDTFKSLQAFAKAMAAGKSTIPKHFQNNEGDCLAVCMQALQWKMNPWNVAQKTHVVNGILGYEGQLVNAVITSSGVTKDRMNYEWFGDWTKVIGKFKEVVSKTKKDEDTGEPKVVRVPNWTLTDEQGIGIKVWATIKGESQPRKLELLLSQCRVRNSPLWADDPRQQIAYLAVKRWMRLHCPDVIMGVYTPDELDEGAGRIEPQATDIQGEASPGTAKNPDYPDERFKHNFPRFKKAIEDGQQTPEAVIAFLEQQFTVTAAQQEELKAVKVKQQPQAQDEQGGTKA